MSTLTRSLLQTDSVRASLQSSALAAHLLSDTELEHSRLAALAHQKKRESLWIFGYGSLIWNPQIEFRRAQKVRVYGYRRALCLWSRINRGTPEVPGLVFGLLPGGSCAGIAYEVLPAHVEAETRLLWRREMLMGSYLPVWSYAYAPNGERVRVLTFRVNPHCVGFAGDLSDAEILSVLGTAQGRFGTCSEYVCNTLSALHTHGIADRRLARLCARLAQSKSQPSRSA